MVVAMEGLVTLGFRGNYLKLQEEDQFLLQEDLQYQKVTMEMNWHVDNAAPSLMFTVME